MLGKWGIMPNFLTHLGCSPLPAITNLRKVSLQKRPPPNKRNRISPQVSARVDRVDRRGQRNALLPLFPPHKLTVGRKIVAHLKILWVIPKPHQSLCNPKFLAFGGPK